MPRFMPKTKTTTTAGRIRKLSQRTSTRSIESAAEPAAATTSTVTPRSSSPSWDSLKRYKAALINELKSQDATPGRQASIRAELETEPLKYVPNLSVAELARLGG